MWSNSATLSPSALTSMARGPPYTLTMNTNINVNDVVKCENRDFGCSLSIDSSINAPADNFNGDVKFSFDLKKFAAIFKVSGSDVDSQLLFVRKVAADGKGLPLDQDKGWWSIHVADGANWQKAVRSKRDALVLQVPTWNQWEQDALPELEALAKPFIDFADAVVLNMDKLPYL